MPLKPGSSKETISENIGEFHQGNTYAKTKSKFGTEKANKQAVAVAFSKARESKGQGSSKKSKGESRKGRFSAIGRF